MQPGLRSKFLEVIILSLGLGLTSCSVFEVRPCSDLEIGEELDVTIQAALDNDPCDPALGVVSGAVIHLSVEEEGDTHTCTTMMGPTTIPGVDLTYESEQSYYASGTDAFLSSSAFVVDACEGLLSVHLIRDVPVEGAPNTFSKMRVRHRGSIGPGCPRDCDLQYSVEVTRM